MKLKSLLITLLPLFSTTVAAAENQAIPAHKSVVEFGRVAPVPALLLANPSLQAGQTNQAGFAPAPALTAMWVYAVGSSNIGWEVMQTRGQFSTKQNHGGALMRAAVIEIGYGYSPFAYMQGSLLPASKIYQTDSVCIVGGYYTWPCPAGYTVVGYFRYINLDGYQNGQFSYRNTSVNSPWNTMSTWINIL